MENLCGKTFKTAEVNAPQGETLFSNKEILMHFSICAGINIVSHLHVGENRSRTWIFSRIEQGILLKHHHRHEDGSEDAVTQYGGWTTLRGSASQQFFPADQQTVDIIPAAGGNVWWFDLIPQKSLTYHLIRLGTDRVFGITFDISKLVPNPPLSWSWEE